MIKIKTPPNLAPYIYKCHTCGSLVRFHKATESYTLVRVRKGGPKNCKFCYNLSQTSIPELIGLKIKES